MFPVISRERLSGAVNAGDQDVKEIADRLQMLFPGGRILIMIREQKRMLASIYSQYVKGGGPLTLEQFVDAPLRHRSMYAYFDIDRMQYHYLIRYYQGLFGQHNVLVLPYEMLPRDPGSVVRQILTVCELPIDDASVVGLNGFLTASIRLFRCCR